MEIDQKTRDILDDQAQLVNQLKSTFVAKDEMVELLITCAIAQEHLLIVGPPGTAKSELIKRFARLCSGNIDDQPASNNGHDSPVNYFEYLLTRFTEPNEIFGPVDIASFQQGKGTRRNIQGMLPCAKIVFLDEVFKANSAILNALLTILNERVFYNGNERKDVPLLCAVGATNTVPDISELDALYDRFLLRAWTDNVEESLFPQLFEHGWKLERDRIASGYGLELASVMTTDDLHHLHQTLELVDLGDVKQPYREVVRRIRAEGIQLSDRRVVKLLKLIAASALRDKRLKANTGDFWILRHVWNDKEQIPHLQTIIDPYVQIHQGDTWSIERPGLTIEGDLKFLEAQYRQLRTDTDYIDFLQQMESLRRELVRYKGGKEQLSAEDQTWRNGLLERIQTLTNQVMKQLEL